MLGSRLSLILRVVLVVLFISILPNTQVSAQDETILVAAGTPFMIETKGEIDSKKHAAGHRFQATLIGDLVAVDGSTAAPNGSIVFGILSSAKKSGRIAGKANLEIEFDSIMVNNRRVPIASSQVQAVTDGTGKKTAGQLARGAAIGGLVDGKSGAKTGAKVGAGAAILSGGNQVYVPAGTMLEVQLREAAHFPAVK